MGRLQESFLRRVEAFCDDVLNIADVLAGQNRSRRVTDQIVGSGTSIGANTYEADEAMSRPDFCKCLGIAVKELNETQFWIRLVSRRQWIQSDRLADLLQEGLELKRIMGAMIAKTRSATDNE